MHSIANLKLSMYHWLLLVLFGRDLLLFFTCFGSRLILAFKMSLWPPQNQDAWNWSSEQAKDCKRNSLIIATLFDSLCQKMGWVKEFIHLLLLRDEGTFSHRTQG